MTRGMYCLSDLSPEQLKNMARNAARTSQTIASALRVLMNATGRKVVDDEVWNAAVSLADAVLDTTTK